MNARIWPRLMLLGVCLGLPASYALAENHDHGKDKDREKHEAAERREHREAREAREARLRHEREEAREARMRHEREEAREARLRRERQQAHEHPAGWNKGKRTGWDHCDVPPGHAKPADCK